MAGFIYLRLIFRNNRDLAIGNLEQQRQELFLVVPEETSCQTPMAPAVSCPPRLSPRTSVRAATLLNFGRPAALRGDDSHLNSRNDITSMVLPEPVDQLQEDLPPRNGLLLYSFRCVCAE